jgi:hypothetical protein
LSAALLDELCQLDCVRDLERVGPRVTVTGDRQIIAYVGAALVRHGTVPNDFGVVIPDLEEAVLTMLAEATDADPSAQPADELVGGRR